MISTVIVAGLGLVAAFVVYRYLLQYPAGAGRAPGISREIHDHAMSFLGRTYALLAMTAIVVALLLFAGFQAWRLPLVFVVGVLCSACAGYLGLYVTWRADSRVAETARTGGASAAFSRVLHGGSVVGLVVAATGLLGLGSTYLLPGATPVHSGAIPGFGLGVFTTALWSRVGGGVTADSIGTGMALARDNEAGAVVDEVHNQGLVAHTGHHNVADTAGVGSDILGAWCGSIIAATMIASTLSAPVTALIGPQHQLMLLPLALASSGFVCSMVGIAIVWLTSDRMPGPVTRAGTVGAAVLFIGVAFFVVQALDSALLVWLCVLGGALGGQAIDPFLEYAATASPARHSGGAAETGRKTSPDRSLVAGLASAATPVAIVVIILAFALALMPDGAGVYGMAIAAVGMLSTAGITLTMHACGPVAGNAARIVAMAEPAPQDKGITRQLDDQAGAAAAAVKAFAVVAGGLAAFVMVAAFIRLVSHRSPDLSLHVSEPVVLLGLVPGAVFPFLLGAMILRAVNRSGLDVSREARRWSRASPGRVRGAAESEHVRRAAAGFVSMTRQIALPGLLALLVPMVVGFGLGARGLGGFLGGALAGALLLALVLPICRRVARQSADQAADAVAGRRIMATLAREPVGNPLEDVAVPSVAVLLNVMAVVSLVIAPLLTG